MDDELKSCRSDTKSVLEEVDKALANDDASSLWERLHSEINSNGIDASMSYLKNEFTKIIEEFDQTYKRLS